MDTNNNNNNKQCECNKTKVVNDLLKRISNLEFEVEDKQRENKELKQKIEYYENFEINKTIDKIRVENNKRFKEQQKELESLKQINKEHQRINGELRVENDRLNNIINELENFMDEDYEYYKKYGSAEQGCAMGQIRRIKNKLQELKGSDKE